MFSKTFLFYCSLGNFFLDGLSPQGGVSAEVQKTTTKKTLLLSPPFPTFMIYAIIGTVKNKQSPHLWGVGGEFQVKLD